MSTLAIILNGYTLLWVTAVNAINATLYDKLNFNFIRDIEPVTAVVRLPNIMVLHPSVPAKSVPEFIAYAKAHPGKINMAYSTSGGARTTASVAILVPAPGRFSTMTCWPSRVESARPTRRAVVSGELAAANPTMMRTGRVG